MYYLFFVVFKKVFKTTAICGEDNNLSYQERKCANISPNRTITHWQTLKSDYFRFTITLRQYGSGLDAFRLYNIYVMPDRYGYCLLSWTAHSYIIHFSNLIQRSTSTCSEIQRNRITDYNASRQYYHIYVYNTNTQYQRDGRFLPSLTMLWGLLHLIFIHCTASPRTVTEWSAVYWPSVGKLSQML